MKTSRIFIFSGGLLLIAALSGCAGAAPTTQAALARTAVANAVAAGAGKYAPAELTTAEDKIEQMNSALQTRQFDTALNLAEQAEMDARVAEIKARAAKAEQLANDLQQGASTPQIEMQTE